MNNVHLRKAYFNTLLRWLNEETPETCRELEATRRAFAESQALPLNHLLRIQKSIHKKLVEKIENDAPRWKRDTKIQTWKSVGKHSCRF